jgi:hypothetical protein
MPAATHNSEYREIFGLISKIIDGPDGFFVEGTMVAEQPDRVREIWDYDTSKQSVLDWANDFAQKTQGKSVGNLRAMHGSTAAGKFVRVEPNDDQKLFTGRAEVVDEAEKEKCRKGVYTGFSLKAPYARKWADRFDPRYTRWTSGPIIETSLVDLPCIPGAVFSYKHYSNDGMQVFEEARKFAKYEDDSTLDALADRVAEKLGRGRKSNNEEMDMLTLKEINEKYAALKGSFDEFGKVLAGEGTAEKCNKSASECMDGDCTMDGHGKSKKAAKADPMSGDVSGRMKDGAPEQPSGDGIKFVSVGKDDKGNELFKRVEVPNAGIKAADIRNIFREELTASLDTKVAEKMAPIEEAMTTLTASIARLSGLAIPTAVKVRGTEVATDKSTDGKSDAEKASTDGAPEDASKVAKDKGATAGIAAIHRNGPAMVLTNRGIVGGERKVS